MQIVSKQSNSPVHIRMLSYFQLIQKGECWCHMTNFASSINHSDKQAAVCQSCALACAPEELLGAPQAVGVLNGLLHVHR